MTARRSTCSAQTSFRPEAQERAAGLTRREFIGVSALACLGSLLGTVVPSRASGFSRRAKRGYLGVKLSPYFKGLEGGNIRCELCPRECEVAPGERGYCGVRENRDGKYYSLVYGNPVAVHVDPVEKKPFFHVMPATASFSIATVGCNFDCKFCQNWEISQARPENTMNFRLPPEDVVSLARANRCVSIASTYVEPTIFMEYMLDVGRLAKGASILNVMHSNGYVSPGPLSHLMEVLDAACIDLKGITDDYYTDITEGSLKPVQASIEALVRGGVHTELVNLLVPTKNDSEEHIRELCRWVKGVSAEIPIHFSRFWPLYKLKYLPPTPISSLQTAHKIAKEEGLNFVYLGNVPGHDAENTFCPKCQTRLISRVGYRIFENKVKGGKCNSCGRPIPGIWPGARVPVLL